MIGKKMLINMALQFFPPEKIREEITKHTPEVLDLIMQKSKEVELLETEKQAGVLLLMVDNKPYAVITTITHDNQISRKLAAYDIVEQVNKIDIEALLEKFKAGADD
jgi:hypothetical protein